MATALPASTSPALATVTGPTLIDTTAVPVSPSPILETDESFESGFIDFEWEFKSKDLDNEFAKKMGEKGEPMEKEPFEWDPVDPLGLLDPLDSPVKDIRKDLDKY